MNRSRLLPALIALLAITSLSVASTTLETSLTTDPDDEINPDWDSLPIDPGEAAAIQESIEGGGEERDDHGDPTTGDPDDGDPDGEAGGDDGAAAGGPGGDDWAGSGSADGTGSAGDERSLFDRLIALLGLLLRYLLPIVAVLAVAALAYRYRAVLADFFGRDSRTTPATEPRSAAGRWPGTAPEHDVDRAWVEMIQRLDPDRPETTTPDEARALARVRGVDHDAVESIASAFERVHYGGRSVDAEIDRARDGLRALEGGVR
ncbi:DUF4129 domain-containing protein [Halorubrum sp. DTA46]|uniref:DUF4129 domain-containing protein n=1 Tax=Halorubrum sp. DTA46 TaxID=3402162 RepID=UPI003AAA4EE5